MVLSESLVLGVVHREAAIDPLEGLGRGDGAEVQVEVWPAQARDVFIASRGRRFNPVVPQLGVSQ